MLECKIKNCTGCGICSYICPKGAIQMIENSEGFKYPKVDKSKCIDCNLCNQICPALNKKNEDKNKNCYAVQIKDKSLNDVASGGAFTAIARYVLKNNGVVFGVSKSDIDVSLKYIMIDKEKELYKIMGSKYYQCNINKKNIEDIIKQTKNKLTLVSGNPCLISAIKNLKNINFKNLITVEILCQGVPSEKVVKKFYHEKENKTNKKIINHNFRSKDKYVGQNYLNKYTYDDGKIEYFIGEEDSLSLTFQRQIFLRESCYNCKYANENRIADFTIGDLWNNKLVEDVDFKKGVSVLICNNDKANNIIRKIENCYIKKIDLEEALKNNIPYHHPVKRPMARNISYKLLNTNLKPSKIAKICCIKYYIKKIIKGGKK